MRADLKEPATQGGATKVAPTRTGEGSPPPHEGEARESDGAKVPSVAEATEVEAPRVSEAKAMEAEAPRTTEDATAAVGAPATTEVMMVEAEAPETTEAVVIAARPLAPEVETKVAVALVAPLVQELETRSLGKSVFLRQERDVWDQLQRQKGLLVGTNELLAARSAEVEDLRLHCADVKAEAAMAQEQVAPLAARVKEFEEELTRVAGERDAFRSQAEEATASGKVLAGQLGTEQSAHQLMKGALDEAFTVAEASRTKAVV
ncbi:uncharacterized protein [Miscanthus floridulus]|uniref:uncharacterized protein n=1 Tax=Miscanthus floridulus TaxID=154761 RepID=UPI003457C072